MRLQSKCRCGNVLRQLLAAQDTLREAVLVQRALQEPMRRQWLASRAQGQSLMAFLAIQRHIAVTFAARSGCNSLSGLLFGPINAPAVQ